MTRVRPASLGIFLSAALCVTAPAFAQTQPSAPAHDPRIGQLIESLSQVKTVRETALSPDGKFIVWSVGGRGGSDIEVAPLDNPSAAKRITNRSVGGMGRAA